VEGFFLLQSLPNKPLVARKFKEEKTVEMFQATLDQVRKVFKNDQAVLDWWKKWEEDFCPKSNDVDEYVHGNQYYNIKYYLKFFEQEYTIDL
jgi:hypothetical protein